jgi:D-alanyl-lipoteichoic acid acyltransferase DltB (MBOAT superfamily)
MLFNSLAFVLGFLPVTLAGAFILATVNRRAAAIWLALASLVFYSVWDWRYTLLLLASVCLNYAAAWALLHRQGRATARLGTPLDAVTPPAAGIRPGSATPFSDVAPPRIAASPGNAELPAAGTPPSTSPPFSDATSPGLRSAPQTPRGLLAAAIVANLALLGYFKYANFLLATATPWLVPPGTAVNVILPLGISFFTFTQIAFLVDVHRGRVERADFVEFLLFVTYFPHLIAGPLLHHGQVMPQFAGRDAFRADAGRLASGATVFLIGLTKKMFVADGLAGYADPIFAVVQRGQVLAMIEAWTGALAYTLQLYFDFSGYSDMALGLSVMLNVRLPINFDSPYRATSVIDFWRRWHMTLSAFLRDYVYIPLGGNRHGAGRRYVNLSLTMLVGGLWHGAGWTYVAWGALHAAYLTVNHGWRALQQRRGGPRGRTWSRLTAGALTFAAVVLGWAVFRAADMRAARLMVGGMLGPGGLSLPAPVYGALAAFAPWPLPGFIHPNGFLPSTNLPWMEVAAWLTAALVWVWAGPTKTAFMSGWPIALPGGHLTVATAADPAPRLSWWVWRPDLSWAAAMGVLLFIALLAMGQGAPSPFLYFQF